MKPSNSYVLELARKVEEFPGGNIHTKNDVVYMLRRYVEAWDGLVERFGEKHMLTAMDKQVKRAEDFLKGLTE